MSLFGSSPPPTPSRNAMKSSLFDDEAPLSKSNANLFDDEPTPAAIKTSANLFADDDSPWGRTPKKADKAGLVKNLLSGAEIPDSYVDAYDALLAQEEPSSSGISTNSVNKLLAQSGVDVDAKDKIRGILGLKDGNQSIGRGEFNVLMALVGLAQEGEETTLDGVDERRRNLPKPSIGTIMAARPAPKQEPATNTGATATQSPPVSRSQPSSAPSPAKSKPMRKESFGYPDSDPWGSPDLHRGHNHGNGNGTTPRPNGANNSEPHRTTSTFTTNSVAGGSDSTAGGQPATTGWSAYNGAGEESFTSAGLGESGFNQAPGDHSGSGPSNPGLGRSVSTGRPVGTGVEEIVTVSALEEKEGMFMFQHRNYEVTSARRNSKVVRRYSDFVWLLDCLHKRYPFRQLPLLPPKRVAINGNHIAAENSFIEKRRRGLARFSNALVRHPVLSQEQLVVMFLTVPTELAVWRKQATISVQEEFVGRDLPPALEDSLPADLQDLFDTARAGVRRSAEIHINLCTLMERLTKRNEGLAIDQSRFALSLQSLTEVSSQTYAADTSDVPLLNSGMSATAKHLSNSQALLEDEAREWDEGVLEDLKKLRDRLVSVRDLFDRRDRLDKDNIPQLERRIQSSESKLVGIRNKPEEQRKAGEAERVEESILKDKQSIVSQHARGVFIKECIRDELLFFQNSQYQISRLHQDWAQERVKYAELQADNWRALGEEIESMPLGEY